ncbi:MAG: mannose-6-phosphate isomerase, class I [Methylohalobius sp.]|nr:mannose-6-phosphate isomerase, class I [Methylohalobius sp.]
MRVEPKPSCLEAAIESVERKPRPLLLHCGVQYYAWGQHDFLPTLLGVTNRDRRPFAELWIGAHPDLAAQAAIGPFTVALDQLLAAIPEVLLGPEAARKYHGQLPFLMKVLAAAQPLSIQVHPDKQQAKAGFARENSLGIPLSSTQRNFRDPNPKPELLCALTDFYALKGFRPEAEIADQLAQIPEWRELDRLFTNSGLKGFYQYVMTLPQEQVDCLLAPMLARLKQQGPFPKSCREYWLLKADELYSQNGHCDRGLFSLYLLNFLHLRPGEAIFQRAGELHCYLEGAGVEVMANSNNVIRGGLTPKHVDIQTLLEIVCFRGQEARVLLPEPRETEVVYPAPAEEFSLSRIELPRAGTHLSLGPLRLGIVLTGKVQLIWEAGRLSLSQGQSYLIPCGCPCQIEAHTNAVLYQSSCRE